MEKTNRCTQIFACAFEPCICKRVSYSERTSATKICNFCRFLRVKMEPKYKNQCCKQISHFFPHAFCFCLSTQRVSRHSFWSFFLNISGVSVCVCRMYLYLEHFWTAFAIHRLFTATERQCNSNYVSLLILAADMVQSK